MKKNHFTLLLLLVMLTSFLHSGAAVVVPTPAAPVSHVASEPDSVTVQKAIAAFKALTKKERKERLREVRKELKAFKAAKKSGHAPETNTVLLVILAILLPPLAVYLYEGEINKRFWISLILTLLFWLPGIIYALVLILGKK